MKGKTIILKAQELEVKIHTQMQLLAIFALAKSTSDYTFIENKKGRQDVYNFVL
jgi:hypothetical protein